ncbi:MAG: hypothetical protein ACOCVR_00245, partial [Myxococcota bacterium]
LVIRLTAIGDSHEGDVRVFFELNGQPRAIVVPDRLDFGSQPVQCGSSGREVCVYNASTADLTLMDVTLSGSTPNAFRLGALPAGLGQTGAPIPAGDRSCFRVHFEASEARTYVGAVEMNLQQIDRDLMVSLIGKGALDDVRTETFEQGGSVTDVLFVVPWHTSAPVYQDELADDAATIFQVAHDLGVDYQIGVISNGDWADNYGEQDGILEPKDRSRPHILTPSTPNAVSVFQQNVSLGTYPSRSGTRHFWSAEKALRPSYLDDPEKNQGFVRPEAHLSLVFLSDHTDNSENCCGYMHWLEGCGTVDYYYGVFARAKGFRLDRLSVHAYAPSETRFLELVELAGGFFADIWVEFDTVNLLPHIFGYSSRFTLSGQPDPDTIEVHIVRADGSRVVAEDWSYDQDANAIVFGLLGLPGGGERVEVSYQPLCAPG